MADHPHVPPTRFLSQKGVAGLLVSCPVEHREDGVISRTAETTFWSGEEGGEVFPKKRVGVPVFDCGIGTWAEEELLLKFWRGFDEIVEGGRYATAEE